MPKEFRADTRSDPPYPGTVFFDPDIITPSDPSSLIDVTYAGRGQRLMFDRRHDWVRLDAYLFDARFDDGLKSEVQVNPEFGSVSAARMAAERYAGMIGQLPNVLRKDVETVWIHDGAELWGGGNDNILIHVDNFLDHPTAGDRYRDFEEEALIHEGAHTSLDAAHKDAPDWLAAQMADGGFISTYARDNPTREDVAESVLPWLAVRYRSGRISQSDEQTIRNAIPNRLAYFDGVFGASDLHPIRPPAVSARDEHILPLVISSSHPSLQGFVRIINRSRQGGTVLIHAFDDEGTRHGPISLRLDASSARQFTSEDLETGSPKKGLSGGVGVGEGNWWLELVTDLDIEPLAYTRPRGDGFLTSVHDVARGAAMRWHVPIFNPGSNVNQQSHLRVVNTSGIETEVVIDGLDDAGARPPGGEVRFTVPADAARTLSARALERGYSGSDATFEFSGRFGDGSGKWQLFVSADRPTQVVSLLRTATGNLTNLSTVTGDRSARGDPGTGGAQGESMHALSMVTPLSEARQTFLRIVNRSERAGTVRIHATDDTGRRVGPVSFSLGARATRHLNSGDLRDGNSGRGLPEGIGTGTGDWRLELATELDIVPLAYIRTSDGFLTTIHDVVAETGPGSMRFRVPIFNPASNVKQRSWLRVVNTSDTGANVIVSGTDDTGAPSSGSEVRFTVPGNAGGMLSARALEEGYSGPGPESDFVFDGRLGDGAGKWRLLVSADQPIQVMSLLASDGGHLTNLSTVRGDDTIWGTPGGDELYGGNRDDIFNPLDNRTSTDPDLDPGVDTVYGSGGDDTVVYTDSGEEAYQLLDYSELTASGIRAVVDGTANDAIVEKAPDGTDTIVDVTNPMDAAGFGLLGTPFGDVFDLTVGDGQFMDVQGNAGDDTFDSRLLGSGWVRVNYLNAPDGVELDLKAGRANDDGHGDVDTFLGDIPRGFAGSEHSDVVRGSDRDETFLGREGNDDIDGGGGHDWLWFGYSPRFAAYVDVRNLEVDLDAGTATGAWNGTSFSYTISNIEAIRGGTGDDDIRGDMAQVRASPGNDTIVFTDGSTYGQVQYDRLPEGVGVTATLDGTTGRGTVSKGSSGTDTIEGIADLMASGGGGFGLVGSDSDDVINVTMDDEQWMQVRGGAGDDTFNIEADLSTYDTVRLDYSMARNGIDLDLQAGTARDDGHGDTDTINGNVRQVRGTDFTDVIRGSANGEDFIGRQGNDTIDGRGGWDAVRFDRSCCATIADLRVRLDSGTATGIWNGKAFSYSISNVEEVRGSDAADVLVGDAGDNRFRARGGDDSIRGGAGNDRLQGEGGRDTFIFEPGHGDDRIDDFANGSETIVLRGMNMTASDVLANAQARSEGTRVLIDLTSFGGGTIDLRDFSIDDLDASDFRIEN